MVHSQKPRNWYINPRSPKRMAGPLLTGVTMCCLPPKVHSSNLEFETELGINSRHIDRKYECLNLHLNRYTLPLPDRMFISGVGREKMESDLSFNQPSEF